MSYLYEAWGIRRSSLKEEIVPPESPLNPKKIGKQRKLEGSWETHRPEVYKNEASDPFVKIT